MKEEVRTIKAPHAILAGSKPGIACAGCSKAPMPSSISIVPSTMVRIQAARTNHLVHGFLASTRFGDTKDGIRSLFLGMLELRSDMTLGCQESSQKGCI